jgi:AraC-like DNA-binding protein
MHLHFQWQSLNRLGLPRSCASLHKEIMSESIRRRAPAQRGRINIEDSWELHWWCERLGCSDAGLREAVKAVGDTATKVAQYLRERKTRITRH